LQTEQTAARAVITNGWLECVEHHQHSKLFFTTG